MGYRVLASAILITHFAFLAYVVVGGVFAWRWPRAIWPHLVAVIWGVIIITFPGIICPLTWAENWARHRGGQSVSQRGFIDRHIEGVLYPAKYVAEARLVVAIVILGSWLIAYRRWRSRRAEAAAAANRRQREDHAATV
jgi:uncharacterized protein DUF2784